MQPATGKRGEAYRKFKATRKPKLDEVEQQRRLAIRRTKLKPLDTTSGVNSALRVVLSSPDLKKKLEVGSRPRCMLLHFFLCDDAQRPTLCNRTSGAAANNVATQPHRRSPPSATVMVRVVADTPRRLEQAMVAEAVQTPAIRRFDQVMRLVSPVGRL